MYFAFFFLLFFAIDILFATRFDTLGMAPMCYFAGGVGLFCCWLFIKRSTIFKSQVHSKLLLRLFISYVYVITIINFLKGFVNLIQSDNAINIFRVISSLYPFLFIFSMVVFIGSIFRMIQKNVIIMWIAYSSFVGCLTYCVLFLFESSSVILWRFSGIFDLFMLFGWLMIVHTLIRLEFNDAI